MLISLRLTNFISVKVLKKYIFHFNLLVILIACYIHWKKCKLLIRLIKLERAMFWLYIQLFLLVSVYHAPIQGILKIQIIKIKTRT